MLRISSQCMFASNVVSDNVYTCYNGSFVQQKTDNKMNNPIRCNLIGCHFVLDCDSNSANFMWQQMADFCFWLYWMVTRTLSDRFYLAYSQRLVNIHLVCVLRRKIMRRFAVAKPSYTLSSLQLNEWGVPAWLCNSVDQVFRFAQQT